MPKKATATRSPLCRGAPGSGTPQSRWSGTAGSRHHQEQVEPLKAGVDVVECLVSAL